MGGSLSLDAQVDLDDRKRLSAFKAQGQVGGIRGDIKAFVNGSELEGNYRFAGNRRQSFRYDGIDTNISGGLSFLMALPPNLQSDSHFRINSLGITPTPPYLTQNFLDYRVGEQVIIKRFDQEIPCHRVTVNQQETILMELLVDQRGVIHQAQLAEMALRAELLRIIDAEGEELWPENKT